MPATREMSPRSFRLHDYKRNIPIGTCPDRDIRITYREIYLRIISTSPRGPNAIMALGCPVGLP